MDSLKPLGKSTADTLERVDLSANPVTDVHGYRDFMFDMLPLLQVLDGLDRSGLEDYADLVHDLDEGAAGKLAKPEDAHKPHWMQERELEDRLIKNAGEQDEEDEDDEDEDEDEDDEEDYAQDDEVELYEEEDDFLPKKPGQGQEEEDDEEGEDEEDEDDDAPANPPIGKRKDRSW